MLFSEPKIPQFLYRLLRDNTSNGFSALQRAENSSIGDCLSGLLIRQPVSVLFSEPKIPQLKRWLEQSVLPALVSVLFSEPKIPQFALGGRASAPTGGRFSALQRAENSSISLNP